MILVEVGEPSFSNMHLVEENNKMPKEALDLAEKIIKEVHLSDKLYKWRAEKRYNSRVKPRSFLKSDLEQRKYGDARKDPRAGKLAANWEGLFRVTEVL